MQAQVCAYKISINVKVRHAPPRQPEFMCCGGCILFLHACATTDFAK